MGKVKRSPRRWTVPYQVWWRRWSKQHEESLYSRREIALFAWDAAIDWMQKEFSVDGGVKDIIRLWNMAANKHGSKNLVKYRTSLVMIYAWGWEVKDKEVMYVAMEDYCQRHKESGTFSKFFPLRHSFRQRAEDLVRRRRVEEMREGVKTVIPSLVKMAQDRRESGQH